jgi:hypothetical protein
MTMTCRDSERLWNELLDARDAARPELETALEAHAADCPACAAIAARYQSLRRAIAAWGPATAPAGFAARVVRAAEQAEPPGGVLPFRRPLAVPRGAWLAAAAVLVASAVVFWTAPLGKRDRLADAPTPPPAAGGLDFSDALADATSATLELARGASAPAGRLGRDVLASAGLPSASPPAPEVAAVPSADVLRSVGDRVGAGVRPLSGSALHAFGFLLPSDAAEAPEAPAAPPRSGA